MSEIFDILSRGIWLVISFNCLYCGSLLLLMIAHIFLQTKVGKKMEECLNNAPKNIEKYPHIEKHTRIAILLGICLIPLGIIILNTLVMK